MKVKYTKNRLVILGAVTLFVVFIVYMVYIVYFFDKTPYTNTETQPQTLTQTPQPQTLTQTPQPYTNTQTHPPQPYTNTLTQRQPQTLTQRQPQTLTQRQPQTLTQTPQPYTNSSIYHSHIETFKLYKFCNLNDTVKKVRTSIYNSTTISTDDKRVLNDMCGFIIDDKLSSIEQNSCGKYLCTDNISDEYKIVDCTPISDKDKNIIIDTLNEIKKYIQDLNVVDENNYMRKIDKTIKVLQELET